MAAHGHNVLVRSTARGTNHGGFLSPPKIKTFEVTVFDVCRFKDGKTIEHWGALDRFAVIAHRRLLPQPLPAVR